VERFNFSGLVEDDAVVSQLRQNQFVEKYDSSFLLLRDFIIDPVVFAMPPLPIRHR
jgi:hypothetical protein